MGCGVGRFQELICLCRLPVELQAFAANPSVLNEDDIREQSESDQRALRDYSKNSRVQDWQKPFVYIIFSG